MIILKLNMKPCITLIAYNRIIIRNSFKTRCYTYETKYKFKNILFNYYFETKSETCIKPIAYQQIIILNSFII